MSEIRIGRYRHFKGNEYEVIGIARHSETLEEMVVYRALYGEGGLWVRPASMWNETVERDGKVYQRFTFIEQEDTKEDLRMEEIILQAAKVAEELVEIAGLKKGEILVVGCSSSEVIGGTIGKNGSMEVAKALYEGIAPVLKRRGIYLAAQCCEHLNRAVIMEKEAAEKYGYDEVTVCPWPHAGGSWATTCYGEMDAPVAVEEIRAHAGLDIGGTLVGMHLKKVAVPVRLSVKTIGNASILCARTRGKLIGGERAHYESYKGE